MRNVIAQSEGYDLIGHPERDSQFRGYLLEDVVTSYLKRLFVDRPLAGALEYDPASGGADLIISSSGLKKDALVIEVGMNKTKSRQPTKTLKKIGRYGLIFSGVSDFGQNITTADAEPVRTKVDVDARVISIAAPVFLLL